MSILNRLIWQIEIHLDSELSLAELSERCAVNVHHMCRMFQLATGMSIMSYIRARRLSKAARLIKSGNTSIVTVALNAGYGSHEAFTRAFVSYFGILPSSLRRERENLTLNFMEPLDMNKDMIVPVNPPQKRERRAFRVVGLGTDCSGAKIGSIPNLWQMFNMRAGQVTGAVPGVAYGVCCMTDEAGNFHYIAGVEATGTTPEMEYIDLPLQNYAVFTHRGHVSDLPKTVYTIWNKAIPDSGIQTARSSDFELYDHRFNVETGRGEVEIWIPIVS